MNRRKEDRSLTSTGKRPLVTSSRIKLELHVFGVINNNRQESLVSDPRHRSGLMYSRWELQFLSIPSSSSCNVIEKFHSTAQGKHFQLKQWGWKFPRFHSIFNAFALQSENTRVGGGDLSTWNTRGACAERANFPSLQDQRSLVRPVDKKKRKRIEKSLINLQY